MAFTLAADDIVTEDPLLLLIKQLPLFCHLPDSVLSALAAMSTEKVVAPGEMVFSAGQYESDDLICCISGRGQMTSGDGGDGSITRRLFAEGDVLGLEFVLAGLPELGSSIGLQAETEMRLVLIDADSFREAISSSHQMAVVLLREMTRRVLGQSMGYATVEKGAVGRVAKVLFGLAERGEESGQWRINTMPRHRDLGVLASAGEKEAAEAVARLIGMHVLKRDYPGMMITDYPALMAIAE
ncbi:Crp/Fnr family transcriptional regulator [Parvularcula flava]|uniref:Crp/Fnr family transcriptional regulator n=1 Tax=Aquisalinus luteolus TaxID=1566827 RepID=A0A8J3A1Z1_9PROT|nr:Crp/Fnr family transcriptional regulator [Aquisalinus luteolus]NHK27969.1 Crp/Fnr family transcriptional regulator [Aquisalinus luteolus]GGH97077.1 hypothetical protein GCM10011355_17420 [Aquisalinus luteolus]